MIYYAIVGDISGEIESDCVNCGIEGRPNDDDMVSYSVPTGHILIQLINEDELIAARSVVFDVVRDSQATKIDKVEDLTLDERNLVAGKSKLKFDIDTYGTEKNKIFPEDRELTIENGKKIIQTVFIDNVTNEKLIIAEELLIEKK